MPVRPTHEQSGRLLVVIGIVSDFLFAIWAQPFVSMGAIATGAGMLILATDRLARQFHAVSRPSADAYQDGWEAGYDKGWREAQERPKMTLIRGRE